MKTIWRTRNLDPDLELVSPHDTNLNEQLQRFQTTLEITQGERSRFKAPAPT